MTHERTIADPRWTSLAGQSEKRVLSQSSGSSTVLAIQQIQQMAPPYAPVDELQSESGRSIRTSTRHSLGQVRLADIDIDGEMDDRTEMPAPYHCQPLASPSSASPLISPQRRVRDEAWSPLTSSPQTATPSTPTAKWRLRKDKDIPEANRRRSVDGGVRIAGGPTGTRLEAPDLNDVEVRSAASTLPPLYQPYGSS